MGPSFFMLMKSAHRDLDPGLSCDPLLFCVRQRLSEGFLARYMGSYTLSTSIDTKVTLIYSAYYQVMSKNLVFCFGNKEIQQMSCLTEGILCPA